MIFHRSQDVIDEWISRLRIYCQFFDLKLTYQMNHKLGGGKFSDVIQAMNLNNKKTYALKKIDKEKLTPKEKLFLRDEIHIVSQLSHPNVVEVREYY
jgi:serine/threonine protein kinase